MTALKLHQLLGRYPLAILMIMAGTALVPATGQAQGIAPRQSDRAVLNMQEAATVALKYLEFAEAAYSPGEKRSISGFRFHQSLGDFLVENSDSPNEINNIVETSGFKGAIYKDIEGNYMISFAGSDNFQDLDAAATQLIVPISQQYRLAKLVGRTVKQKNMKATFVGHSLGGGLAQEASYQSNRRGIGFNTLGSNFVQANLRGNTGHNFISFNVGFDFAVMLGSQQGTEYILPGSINANHKIDSLKDTLDNLATRSQPGRTVTNWARVNTARGNAYSVVTSNISTVGNGNTSHNPPTPRNSDTLANDLFVTQDAVQAESQFRLVEGDEAINLQQHGNSIGSLRSPANTRIYTVNNAGRRQTIVEKDFVMAAGVNRFYLTGFGSFITTEYPEFVGTQYNDRGMISLHTLGGQAYPLRETVNRSNFIPVQNLPAPLLKAWEQASGSGGATPFKSLQSRSALPFLARPSVRVAPGGTVTLRMQVLNVGDTLFPSAIAVTNLSAE
ncbi:hypothetical protein [Saliniramus fredricksonii]|nr:hypothetical protein [Saliniramus fredricksonii]